jgi:lipopolysaccharide cholinephosphotransferase
MPRSDCEKLMKLSGGRIGDFELVAASPSPSYFAYHWKLYSESILIAKRKAAGIGSKVYPIFLDIFPIEGLPDTEAKNDAHYAEIRRRKNRVSHARNISRYRGPNPYRVLRNYLAARIYRTVGVQPLFDKVIDLAASIRLEDSDYIGVMMTNVHTTEERVLKSEYSPVIKMEFEGHMLSCPLGYDTYLRQLYGANYMEWLPVYQRIPRHNFATFLSYAEGEKPLVVYAQPEAVDSEMPIADDEDMADDVE